VKQKQYNVCWCDGTREHYTIHDWKTLQTNSKVHNQKTFAIFEIQKQENSSHKQKHGECFKEFQQHNVSHFHLG
jgi:hypothetical protein